MSGLLKTKTTIDLPQLQDWYLSVQNLADPVWKDTTIDYAKDYFEAGSVGYGWALHVFEEPENMQRVWWRHPDRKEDPMIRSKGRIFFNDGTKGFIGNEHFTARTEICNGYMNEILDMFPEAYRGAIWVMKKGFKFVEHVDFPQEETFRIHIVVDTNPRAMFKLDDEILHMPADGHLWMVQTGTYKHTAWNDGDTDRVHIHFQMPIEVWDKYRVSLNTF